MHIIHIGIAGFPGNSAPIQRVLLTFKGLSLTGFQSLIINKESISPKKYKRVQRFEGLPFIFTSFKTERPSSFIVRNLNKLTGLIGEVTLLIKIRKKIGVAILYTPSFFELFYYRIVSKLIGFKIIIQYVELRSSIPDRNSFSNKLNDHLFDNYFYLFCDGVIAISDFLVTHVTSKCNKMPVLKIPAMCDFAEYKQIQSSTTSPYIMYCGSIAYNEVIEFILEIYSSLIADKIYNGDLVLVISGSHDNNWKKIRAKIDTAGIINNVLIKSNIPYSELLSLYKGADVLLIPLRKSIQDTARFPHKIGEYTASGRPIVSTNIGELKIYFNDGVSAILADDYTVTSYLDKLTKILSDKSTLDNIGKAGYTIGVENFDFHNQGVQLQKFILNL